MTSGTGPRPTGTDPVAVAGIVAAWTLFALFAFEFQPWVVAWGVDGLWLGAIVTFAFAIRRLSGSLLPVHPRLRDVLLPAVLLAVFAVCWLPFYDNWRWAYTGDSLAWFATAAGAVQDGLKQNLLSVHGVDDNFTYLHSLAFNALLFVFGPTLFWHRVGKLIVSCLSLAMIYTYFTATIGRRWAAAIVCCLMTNYVWLWFSYVSYGHIDSHIFYFGTLMLATLIWQHPDHLGAWLLCGIVGGLSLFFTQTAWSAVAAAGLVLGVFALATRRVRALVVYAMAFLLAGSPVLMQLEGLLTMTARQAGSQYQWDYLVRIFTTILRLPFDSPLYHIGIYGAYLRWPLGGWYVAGAVLAALGVLPPLRRFLRVPTVAPMLLGMLLWDTLLMTLTNGGYGLPSSKRTYNLLPLQVFLALLPAYVAVQWLDRWAWLRRAAVAVLCAGIATYGANNLSLLMHPEPAVYGVNLLDGLIELRQRFPERRVLLLTTREEYPRILTPDSFFQQAYKLLDQTTIETTFDAAAIERTCSEQMVLCYEPNADRERFDPLRERYESVLRRFPLLNATELVCYECVRALAAASA
ncbi:MAG TPA: hypothetical protein VL403_15395 [Candidatus Kryptonia bacterium]|nr:hypothetical protein [Candidatus Kryptonia bacterium]